MALSTCNIVSYFIKFNIAYYVFISRFRNDQLRGAMLTLVSSYNTLENNLERHEIRERALGEVIKKGLQTLHKGQRIFEPMRGTFARLDERISQMESLLMLRENEQKDQNTHTGNLLGNILQWMNARDLAEATAQDQHLQRFDKVMAAIAAATTNTPAVTCKSVENHDGDDGEPIDVSKKIEDLTESVKRLRQELAEVLADRIHADESAMQLCVLAERTVSSKMAASDDLMAKLEDKLLNLYVTAPLATSTAMPQYHRNVEWEERVQSSLSSIEQNIRSIQNTSENIAIQSDRNYFAVLANETLEAISDMRFEVLTASDKSFAKTATRIKDATNTLNEALNESTRTLFDAIGNSHPASAVSADIASNETFNERVLQNYAELRNDIAGLRQLEKIMLDTGNNVLAVKRGMEYNVHAITMEIGEVIRVNVATIDNTLTEQFGVLNETIYENHNGALANLTSKIETEISQVWRQIGIMFQLVQSTEMSLNKLQEQTEIYVNGTSVVMDGMGGKVCSVQKIHLKLSLKRSTTRLLRFLSLLQRINCLKLFCILRATNQSRIGVFLLILPFKIL